MKIPLFWRILFITGLVFSCFNLRAQPYSPIGNTSIGFHPGIQATLPIPPPNGCLNTFTLTQNAQNQAGAIWNDIPQDLSQNFTLEANLFFGEQDLGADGIAFILRNPLAATIGIVGGSMGYQGIQNSIAIEFDDLNNGNPLGDIAQDHLDIVYNGMPNQPNLAPNLPAIPVKIRIYL